MTLTLSPSQLARLQKNLGRSPVTMLQDTAVSGTKPRKKVKQSTNLPNTTPTHKRGAQRLVEWKSGCWQGKRHYYRNVDEHRQLTACGVESYTRQYIQTLAPDCELCIKYLPEGEIS